MSEALTTHPQRELSIFRSRLMLDVSGHRLARRAELTALATVTAAGVIDSGESALLAPMNPFERKVVHDAISAIDGVRSESEGEERAFLEAYYAQARARLSAGN